MGKKIVTDWRIGLLVLFCLSCFLYLSTLMAGAVWDDTELINGSGFGKNTYLSALTKPFLQHYFRPLTSVSFVFDSSYSGQTPFFYHQTNILLHAIAVLLIACLTYALTEKKLAGILAGLYFVAQPFQVGAVAWIGGRTDVLSGLFIVAFMLCLVRYYQSNQKGWLVFSALSFLLAACSKEQAFALLPAVPISVFALGSRKWVEMKRISLPFVVAAVGFVGFWAINAPFPQGAKDSLLNTLKVGFRTTALYGGGFFVPNNQSLMTWTLENYRGPLWIAIGVIFFIGFVWLMLQLWKRNRPVAWVAICGLLVYIPVCNFPPVPTFVVGPYRCAETGTAVACLFGIGMCWAIEHRRILIALPFAANLIAAVPVTLWGIRAWKTEPHFFDVAAHTDKHFIVAVAHHVDGLDAEGRSKEGLIWTQDLLTWIFGTPNWDRQIEEKQQKSLTPATMARLHTNSGLPDVRELGWLISTRASTLHHLNRDSDAIRIERDALIISPMDPRINFSYGSLVVKKDRVDAIRHWEMALRVTPRFPACASALAHERIIDHRFQDAVNLLEPVISDLSWNCEPWLDLADAKIGLHDYAGARTALVGASKAILVRKEKIQQKLRLLESLEAKRK